MSQQAAMTRAVADQRRRWSPPLPPEPAVPWVVHRFNPSVPPVEPITDQLRGDPYNATGAAPVMWFNQCRDCFGWVDDPRHS